MIVKVQLPLYESGLNPRNDAFVYNEDRSVEFFLPCSGELVDAMGGELRAFFEVDLSDGECALVARIEEQGW